MSVLKRSDPSFPPTRPSFSRAPGLLRAPAPADGGECRIVPEAALDQTNLNRWGAGTGAACIRDAGPGPVREFPLFEHGAGI
jgi:hypothetical protein